MAVRRAANRWRPDSEAASCPICSRNFGLFCRRHHCRQCGDVFCSECSAAKRIVPIVHASIPQRVCKKCLKYAFDISPNRSTTSFRLPASANAATSDIVSGPLPPGGSITTNATVNSNTAFIAEDRESVTDTSSGQPKVHSVRRGGSSPECEENPTPAVPFPAAPPGDQAGDVGHTAGVDVEEDMDESGLTGTPPSIRPNNTSDLSPATTGGALSFMAALEDATRVRNLSLPVLLYVREGHELPIVTMLEAADETIEETIRRLSPQFYQLNHVRKRPTDAELESLSKQLEFVNEAGNPIPKHLPVSDLCRRVERVILTTAGTPVVSNNKNSSRSLTGFFMQSERSADDDDDDSLGEIAPFTG